MFGIFCNVVGVFIGFFFGLNICFDRNLNWKERWRSCLIASIIIGFNTMLLVDNLKTFFK